MSKYLPILAAVVIGLLVVGGGFFAWRSLSKPPEKETEIEKEDLGQLSPEERPYVTLTPGPSCEYTLALDRIQTKPEKIEYEIVYQDEKGVTQGASGTLKVGGKTKIEKDVLFGTESSGHRKCDKGVEEGTITLRFRNAEGKLTAKLETEFAIAEGTTRLSVDGAKVVLDGKTKGKYLLMGTLGLPAQIEGNIEAGPFGVFPSSESAGARVELSGSGKIAGWNGSDWVELDSSKASFLGTYIRVE